MRLSSEDKPYGGPNGGPKGGAGTSGQQTRKAKKGTKVYITHDNGNSPFRVEDDGKSVVVFRQRFDFDTKKYNVIKEVYRTPYKKLFVGEDPYKFSVVWEPWMRGNSILLHLGGLKYVFIGHNIMSFEIDKDDEEIVKYISSMGNSGVPYPYAIGKSARISYRSTKKTTITRLITMS